MLSMLDFVGSCRTRGTRDQYRQAVCLFFECLTGQGYEGRSRPPEHVAQLDAESVTYLSETRDYTRDLIRFASFLSSYAPSSQNSHMTTVLLWLDMNDIIIPRSKQKFIRNRLPNNRAITKDHTITHEEIKRWYEHLSRVGRVVLLVQLSSGMRIGEVLALMPGDVDFSTSPVAVHVRGTWSPDGIKEPKNGLERYSFLSSESVFALNEWLEYRDEYLRVSCLRSGGRSQKDPADPRLIPVVHNTVQSAYINGLKKAGLYAVDSRSRRTTITSHSLRKFFISQMKAAGMTPDIVEMLSGHSGYLSDAYRRYPVDQVGKEYLNAEYAVSLSAPDMQVRAELESQSEILRSVLIESARNRLELDRRGEQLDRLLKAAEIAERLAQEKEG